MVRVVVVVVPGEVLLPCVPVVAAVVVVVASVLVPLASGSWRGRGKQANVVRHIFRSALSII